MDIFVLELPLVAIKSHNGLELAQKAKVGFERITGIYFSKFAPQTGV